MTCRICNICEASLRCGWACVSSSLHLDWMICCNWCKCATFLHCASVDVSSEVQLDSMIHCIVHKSKASLHCESTYVFPEAKIDWMICGILHIFATSLQCEFANGGQDCVHAWMTYHTWCKGSCWPCWRSLLFSSDGWWFLRVKCFIYLYTLTTFTFQKPNSKIQYVAQTYLPESESLANQNWPLLPTPL